MATKMREKGYNDYLVRVITDDSNLASCHLIWHCTAQDIINSYGFSKGKKDLTVIFSTYQSIQAIADAQKKGLPEFNLIICDEAHRTTGVTVSGADESYFVKVHDRDFIKGKKRLYMTATPKIYEDSVKVQAQENDALLCSMDDVEIYGGEFHRLGFGEAVGNGLLTDYKVMVLAVDEKYVSATFQRQLADADNELNLEDAVKITGCWNGLSKRMKTEDEDILEDLQPMQRAVAFSRSIKDSQKIVDLFGQIITQYKKINPDDNVLDCELDHVDGTQNSLERTSKLEWLKADTSKQGNICRILSNARCLSEGVDVPALDAVIFLTPRNSVVDVVQSVGRVMRKAEGKKYGYIILPVGIPADMSPEVALKDNNKYKVIWQVLQALRAHDDRFNATVNKIDLNRKRPPQINIIGVGGGDTGEGKTGGGVQGSDTTYQQLELNFPIEEWRDAIYAKIVVKCGNRRYWEDWAKDVAVIADRHISRIKGLLANSQSEARQAFDEFLAGLHCNLNPNVTEDEAIEMLSQHLITKPVFDALFEGYEFTKFNPVSQTMQRILDVLEGQSLEKETQSLTKFYESVRDRASGIDNAQGKQKIIVELYDKFFRNAFPRLVERLGIVYTPVEVVDFIINSADYALKQEFGVGLTDEGVHILDPFTGTGTFLVRLLQSGLIKPEDLQRKFTKELHANEILLLAYYIAAINIEETYHYLTQSPDKKISNQLLYYDIGNYLNPEKKLNIIHNLGDISAINWVAITPNDNYDWINQRNDIFESFISLGDKKDKASKTIFDIYSLGVSTNRDQWVYSFSEQSVIDNMTRMINFYNEQVEEFRKSLKGTVITNVKDRQKQVENFIDNDPKKISWSSGLKNDLSKFIDHNFIPKYIRLSVYRPFCKQKLYFDNNFNERLGQFTKIFPNQDLENLVICVVGNGAQKEFSALITNAIPNLHFQHTGQCFPLYTYEKQSDLGSLFASANTGEYVKKENIPDEILTDFQKIYKDKAIKKEDIFYYVYGVLHSSEYKERFASDLKKMLPRIPFCEDFWAFSKAGKDLAYWHLNYEEIEPYPVEEIKKELFLEDKDYQVEKMVFAKNKKEVDKTTIIYNSKITLSQIPLETYEYIVNGKSALEWVMERYKITKDKDSGIVNNPNDWSENPRYIIDLVKRIMRVSLESVKIVKGLPPLKERI